MSTRYVLAGICYLSLAASALAQLSTDRYGRFGLDETGIDRSARPGNDFNRFANGAWSDRTTIPADRSSYGVLNVLAAKSNAETVALLEAARNQPESKIGIFYGSYMDQAKADARGLAPLIPYLEKISKAKDKSELAVSMADLQRRGVRSLTDLEIAADPKHTTSYAARLHQYGIGLPVRDDYLDAGASAVNLRSAYKHYITQLLVLVGDQDAASRAAAVIAFERKVAIAQWTGAARRDAEKTYNPWKVDEFLHKAPGLDWDAYLGALGLRKLPVLIVNEPSALVGEASAWAETPLPVLKDWLLLHTLDRYAPFLSKPFVEAEFAFNGTAVASVPRIASREKRGAVFVSDYLRDLVGQAFVSRYFPAADKAAAEAMVRSIIAAYRVRLEAATWLSPGARAQAVAKLDNVRVLVGYPERWRDYSSLVVSPDDLVGNVARAADWEYSYQLRKFDGPVDRSDWVFTPMTVGGWSAPELVNTGFPAAILQPPIFDATADPAVNYGAFGAIVGHEISHLFDDQGRKFNSRGELVNWWSSQDSAGFTERADRLVKQYDQYSSFPGGKIDGALTLGENLADLSGLVVALDAYHASLSGKEAPVLDGLSGDQRFFLGYAQLQRYKYRDAELRRQLSDPHPPAEQRIDEVRNIDAWYTAFDVTPADALYLPPDARVRLW